MAKLSINTVRNVLMVIIVLIIVLQVLADTGEDVGSAAGNVSIDNATGDMTLGEMDYDSESVFPLTSFFKRKGILLLAMIAGIVIIVISSVLPKGSK